MANVVATALSPYGTASPLTAACCDQVNVVATTFAVVLYRTAPCHCLSSHYNLQLLFIARDHITVNHRVASTTRYMPRHFLIFLTCFPHDRQMWSHRLDLARRHCPPLHRMSLLLASASHDAMSWHCITPGCCLTRHHTLLCLGTASHLAAARVTGPLSL